MGDGTHWVDASEPGAKNAARSAAAADTNSGPLHYRGNGGMDVPGTEAEDWLSVCGFNTLPCCGCP